jgi:hypothetical protein
MALHPPFKVIFKDLLGPAPYLPPFYRLFDFTASMMFVEQTKAGVGTYSYFLNKLVRFNL